jgi:hypothetical protein
LQSGNFLDALTANDYGKDEGFRHSLQETPMSDIVSKNSDDPDAGPVNERSSAFIDGAAFLEFVRLKSLVVPQDGGAANDGASSIPAGSADIVTPNGHGQTVSYPHTDAHSNCRIDVGDWDSLFGAVEERLRDTVEKADLAATPLAAQYNAWRVKSVVLDCVSALDKLHRALRQERSLYWTHPATGPASDK